MATKKTNTGTATSLWPSMNSDLAKQTENALFNATHIQGTMFRSMIQYNLELASFLQRRLEADLKTAEAMSNCRSFAEFNKAGVEFMQRSMEEYRDEAAKLANMGAGLMSQNVEDVQHETSNATMR